MKHIIIAVALSAALVGCSLSPANQSPAATTAPGKPAAAHDNDWWESAALTPQGAMKEGLFIADSDKSGAEAAKPDPSAKPALPPDLNKGKCFFAPDREFAYLYAHYKTPDRHWYNELTDTPTRGFWEDTKTLAQWKYIIPLAVGGAVAGGVQPLDHKIERHLKHTDIAGGHGNAGNYIGHPGIHFFLAGSLYAYGLSANDDQNRTRGAILIEGLAYDNLATLALKAIFNRETPNGKGFWASTIHSRPATSPPRSPWLPCSTRCTATPSATRSTSWAAGSPSRACKARTITSPTSSSAPCSATP